MGEAQKDANSTGGSATVGRVAPGKAERVNSERAGQILGLHPRTVQKMAQRGEIPGAAKIGRRWTFNEDKLRSFVRQKERETWHAQKHQPDVTGARIFSGAAPKSKAKKYDGPYTRIIQQLRDSAARPERRELLRIVTTETRPDFSRK
jgi:excisionase family DNA binding protein